jgi:hypothetical protein
MGYFPNGTSGEIYESKYCSKCLHQELEDIGCPIWHAHMMYNYDECNNEKSILHLLIPRSEDGIGNEECTMFVAKPPKALTSQDWQMKPDSVPSCSQLMVLPSNEDK